MSLVIRRGAFQDNGFGSCQYGLNPWVGTSSLQEAIQKEKTASWGWNPKEWLSGGEFCKREWEGAVRVLERKPRKSRIVRSREKEVSRRKDWADNFKIHSKDEEIKSWVNHHGSLLWPKILLSRRENNDSYHIGASAWCVRYCTRHGIDKVGQWSSRTFHCVSKRWKVHVRHHLWVARQQLTDEVRRLGQIKWRVPVLVSLCPVLVRAKWSQRLLNTLPWENKSHERGYLTQQSFAQVVSHL